MHSRTNRGGGTSPFTQGSLKRFFCFLKSASFWCFLLTAHKRIKNSGGKKRRGRVGAVAVAPGSVGEQIPEYRAELGASLGKIKEKNKTNKKPKKKATGAASQEGGGRGQSQGIARPSGAARAGGRGAAGVAQGASCVGHNRCELYA